MDSCIVLGAGIAGLTLADRLSSRGVQVTVLEKESEVGGLARGVHLDGSRVDLGPHNVRAKWPEVLAYYRDLLGDDLLDRTFRMKVLFRGQVLSYPVNPLEILKRLPPGEVLKSGIGFGLARLLPAGEVKTFEDWARSQYGGPLFESFFGPLTEKIWAVPSKELDGRLAKDRLPPLKLSRLFGLGRKARHAEDPLATAHYYPRLGVYQIAEKILERLRSRGVTLRLSAQVTAIRETPGEVVVDVDGRRLRAHTLASTIPVSTLSRLHGDLAGLETGRLKYRGLGFTFLSVPEDVRLSGPFTFTADPEVAFNRVTDFSYCSRDCLAEGKNVLCLEYNVPHPAQLALKGDKAVASLVALGWLDPLKIHERLDVNQSVVYPVYLKGHADQWGEAARRMAYLPRLLSLGRQGLFTHSNIDDVIQGVFKAESLLLDREADLETRVNFYLGHSAEGNA